MENCMFEHIALTDNCNFPNGFVLIPKGRVQNLVNRILKGIETVYLDIS